MRKRSEVEMVQKWFSQDVTYEGEAYVMDYEQAEAVVDNSLNAIVVARAGSGKTRTIVAKIVYLIAKCGVMPDEIMAFVFNANAASEINARILKMRVNGKAVVKEEVTIASTFHAFSKRIVYDVCGGREKCGEILAERKDEFILRVIQGMLKDEEWEGKIEYFINGENGGEVKRDDLVRFSSIMAQFVNRGQQSFLGGEVILSERAKEYLGANEVDLREEVFIKIGVECYRRYHWYLLSAKRKLRGFSEYGTDFNLIVSWASKMILAERGEVLKILSSKKYILIDEYQDFSQLFLAAVQAVRKVARDSRLFVVGDDWQAINRFAGSDVDYFKNFESYFSEDCKRYEITTNYRCNREIVDTARRFMKNAMKEKGNFRAFSKKMGRVTVVDARDNKKEYLKLFVKILRENRKAKDIMILHRNNDTHLKVSLERFYEELRNEILQNKVMSEKDFDEKVRIMTMHKSKGLEAEVVIIMEADAGIIPKTHPDTSLFRMFGETEEVALDDQKRLFYVAMTRAKKRLYIMHERVKKRKMNGFTPYLGRGIEWWEE